jgi:hypothetical protein
LAFSRLTRQGGEMCNSSAASSMLNSGFSPPPATTVPWAITARTFTSNLAAVTRKPYAGSGGNAVISNRAVVMEEFPFLRLLGPEFAESGKEFYYATGHAQ